eukprot:1136137-Pelagomonas_calceolata.AAC.1
MARLVEGMGSADSPTHTQEDWVDMDVTLSFPVLSKHLYLDLPKHIVCSVARFHLRVRTLKVEQATWNDNFSSTCDLCDAQDDACSLQMYTPPHLLSPDKVDFLVLWSSSFTLQCLFPDGSMPVFSSPGPVTGRSAEQSG